jgi:hypothetical protein
MPLHHLLVTGKADSFAGVRGAVHWLADHLPWVEDVGARVRGCDLGRQQAPYAFVAVEDVYALPEYGRPLWLDRVARQLERKFGVSIQVSLDPRVQ